MYRDDYFLVEHSVMEDSKAWYAWHIRALKRWHTASYREALIYWVMAKLISPKEFKLHVNIATVLRLLKKTKESDEHIRLAEENIIPGQEERAKRVLKEIKEGKSPLMT